MPKHQHCNLGNSVIHIQRTGHDWMTPHVTATGRLFRMIIMLFEISAASADACSHKTNKQKLCVDTSLGSLVSVASVE